MNIQGLLVAVLLWVASVAGSYWYGNCMGQAIVEASEAKVKQAIEKTRKVAMEGAAHEIANIKVRNTTIQGRVETVVRDNPVYRDCGNTADGMRYINEALTGRAQPTGPGGVPRTGATP